MSNNINIEYIEFCDHKWNTLRCAVWLQNHGVIGLLEHNTKYIYKIVEQKKSLREECLIGVKYVYTPLKIK